jgi:hypothetical protein
VAEETSDALNRVGDAAEGQRILAKLAAELERRGVTAEEIGRLSRLSMWQQAAKVRNGDTDEIVTTDLYGFQLAPSWQDGPQWPVVHPGPVVKVTGKTVTKPAASKGNVVAVLPDMQIGYYRHPDNALEPTHDPAAIDAALASALQSPAPRPHRHGRRQLGSLRIRPLPHERRIPANHASGNRLRDNADGPPARHD